MTHNGDQHPPEVDVFEQASEALLYGDPALAKDRLRDAIYAGAQQIQQHQQRQGIL